MKQSGYKKWPVSPDALAQQFRGKPFGELILHQNVKRQSLRQINKQLLRIIGFLPSELEEWIDLNNKYGVRVEFWRSDCGDVLLSIVDRARVFSTSHGINADDDTLLNLFQIVVFSFADTAHREPRSKAFIQQSAGIKETYTSRLFSRIFR